MKGGATGTWVTQKIKQVLHPSKTLQMLNEFGAKVDLMFMDLNQVSMTKALLSVAGHQLC